MLDRTQFRELVIRPTLEALDLGGDAAEELLLGTALQESRLTYLKQLGGGPALGVYQMEPLTHEDIWGNYLKYRDALQDGVFGVSGMPKIIPEPEALIGNLTYATAMARVHYLRVPEILPMVGDLQGQARYWKQHYNTPLGAGTAEEYIENWERAHG